MTQTVDARMADLFDAVVARHATDPALMTFCAMPDDIAAQPCPPFETSSARRLASETGFDGQAIDPLAALFRAASPAAKWRETYKDTDLPRDFLDAFGSWCLIGSGGPYTSDHIASYMLYMPAGLWYPWHHHPAEELYVVLAGSGEFLVSGEEPQQLGVGDAIMHEANQPHALRTTDAPILCYVVWRNGFGIPPVLTPPDQVDAPLGRLHPAR